MPHARHKRRNFLAFNALMVMRPSPSPRDRQGRIPLKTLRVLIVEDEIVIALDLELLVIELVPAEIERVLQALPGKADE
jgi:hypothetical protein